MRISIHYKIALIFISVIAAILAGVYFYLNASLTDYTYQRIRGNLIKQAALAATLLEDEYGSTEKAYELDEMADFTTFVCMIYIASLYTGFPKIVIALGLGLWVYQMVEKNAFKNGYQISPTVNVLTHTWFIYAIVLAFFVLTH